jgi:RNA recognition motif-containing protein
MSGRADLSTNWRVKSEAPASSPTGPQQEQQPTPPKNVKDDPVALQAMAEGRRLYVGNLAFTAKREDIAAHFQERDFTLQVPLQDCCSIR